jgi:hypothetical protein
MTSGAEFQLRRRADAADRARAFIEDPLLVGAFERLEQRFMDAWRRSSPLDSAGRETIWHHVQALAEVRGELRAVLEDGDLARDQLAEISAGITQP